jgi:hypothetical protein
MIFFTLLTQLTQLFHVGFSFITAENTDKAQWRTNRKYRLTNGEFVKLYADPLSLLGVSFGNETRYVMLDIDIDSPYHPNNDPEAYARLLLVLEEIGLVYPIPIRSSHSGGIHIYFFFSRSIRTFRIAALVRVTLINARFPIKNGHLEIFPNTKAYSNDKQNPTYYKAHRLPLQPNSGSCLLDQWGDELICAANLGHEAQLEMFLAEASKSAEINDIDALEGKLDWAYDLFTDKIGKYQHYAGNYSEVAQDWKENLELSMEIGWTAYHQTNELLPLFISYGIVFLALEDKQDLFDWVYQKVVTTRGYSEYCRHQHEIERRIWDWTNCTTDNQYYIKYCGFPPRCGITPHQLVAHLNPARVSVNQYNQNIAQAALERLKAVIAAMNELPAQVVRRMQAIQAKAKELFGMSISINTLNKYRDIWHPKQVGVASILVLSTPIDEAARSCDETILNLDYSAQSVGKMTAPTPPIAIAPPEKSQSHTSQQIEPIESIPVETAIIPETQVPATSDRTPPPYEAFITAPLPSPDLAANADPQAPTPPDLQAPTHLYDHTSIAVNSALDLESPEPDLTFPDLQAPTHLYDHTSIAVNLALDLESPELDLTPPDLQAPTHLYDHTNIAANLALDLESPELDLTPPDLQAPTHLYDHTNIAANLALDLESPELDLTPPDLQAPTHLYDHTNIAANLALDLESPELDLKFQQITEGLRIEPPETENITKNELSVIEIDLELDPIVVGTKMRRNARRIHGKDYSELVNCQVVGLNGMDFVVQSAGGSLFNVSNYSIDSGFWEIEVQEAAETLPNSSIGLIVVGATVRTLTGLLGVVKYIFGSMPKPFVVYHESICRTIVYGSDDLHLNS